MFNDHPIGKALRPDRLEVMMDEGGVTDCGKAGNCNEVCPKEIPLTTSIASMNREVSKLVIKDIFFKDEPPKHGGAGPA